MRDHLKWLFLATLVLSFLAGCGSDTGTTTTAPSNGTTGAGPAAAKKLNLAFITNNASDFWTIARAGCKKAEEEMPNVTVDFQIPSDGTAAQQKRIIDDLLAKGVDGIAISPVDPTNETPMLKEVSEKTLVFTHDSDAPDSGRTCYVGTNNVDAGKQAGELVKKVLPNGGKIMVFVGTLDAQNAHDRFAGLKQALEGSNVTVIDCRTDDTDRVRAKANVADTIVKYPDVAGFVGLWSYNGPAILNAVTAANKVGAIKIVAFDEEDETLAGVKTGAISGTIVQQPYEFGHQAIELMAKYLSGDKSGVPESHQIFVPTQVIAQDNVDAFSTKLKLLRGR